MVINGGSKPKCLRPLKRSYYRTADELCEEYLARKAASPELLTHRDNRYMKRFMILYRFRVADKVRSKLAGNRSKDAIYVASDLEYFSDTILKWYKTRCVTINSNDGE
jgi:hypothetical protein